MRALILCAGTGSRLMPFTECTPKPLFPLPNGSTLLRNTIQYLHEANIFDITLITGYLKEQIRAIAQKYSCKTIHNPFFETHNNHKSLQIAGNLLEDSFVIDGDLYLTRNIFLEAIPFFKQHKQSFFVVQKTNPNIPEWEVLGDDKANLIAVKKNSPQGYSMSGVSFWNQKDAKTLQKAWSIAKKEDYWEDIVLKTLPNITPKILFTQDFQNEIDSLSDAIHFGTFSPDFIAQTLSTQGTSIRLSGLTNHTFLIHRQNESIVLRLPTTLMRDFFDRKEEKEITKLLRQQKLTVPANFYYGGVKTSPYRTNTRTLLHSIRQKEAIHKTVAIIQKVHQLTFNPKILKVKTFLDEVIRYETNTFTYQNEFPCENIYLLSQQIHALAKELDQVSPTICHRDLVPENILVNQNTLQVELIDLEYAAVTSPYWDWASLSTELHWSYQEEKEFLPSNINWDLLLKAKIVLSYIWSLWGWVRNNKDYGRRRWKSLDFYLQELLQQKELIK